MQLGRPRPQAEGPAFFSRAPDVEEWLVRSFIESDAPLHRESLAHLQVASIGVLWVRPQEKRRGKIVAGKAGLMKPPQSLFGWEKELWWHTMNGFFGAEDSDSDEPQKVPDFLIRFWVEAALEYDDASWLALCFHELRHMAQEEDEFGAPKFNRQGAPVWTIRGHDLEEFSEVAEMFGVGALGMSGKQFYEALRKGPTVAQASITAVCGTCLGRE